eukprot:GHVR01038575.1.p1 GENE.GHVR01038575.1~~GHVR01038575.1.p1  ORF type:complete len:126 (+),score=7.14 GHVR01038575.1:420-797(+)
MSHNRRRPPMPINNTDHNGLVFPLQNNNRDGANAAQEVLLNRARLHSNPRSINLLNAIIRVRDESYRSDIKDIYDKVQQLDNTDPQGIVPGLTPREQRIWHKVRIWYTAEMRGPNADGPCRRSLH